MASNGGAVFIVDADPYVRDSVSALVSQLGHVAHAFSNSEEFSSALALHDPVCLVLDVELPGDDGLALFERLRRIGRWIPAIFVSGRADAETVVAAMKLGAFEFMAKPAETDRLRERIASAIELGRKHSSRLAEFRRLEERVRGLSDNDWQTLSLIRQGFSNKSIAEQLGISQRAVELRRQRMLQKASAKSLPELIEMMITHRFLKEDLGRQAM